MSLAKSVARNAVAMPTSSMLTSMRLGAREAAFSMSSSKRSMPEAARVWIGPGRDGMNPDSLRSELGGKVTRRRLQGGLDRTHDVVVLDHLLRTVIAHREQGATILHQGLGQLGHADERVARDVHGHQETVARTVGDPAVEILAGREGDGMKRDIK